MRKTATIHNITLALIPLKNKKQKKQQKTKNNYTKQWSIH